jgi:hypothetical protein
LSAPNYPHFDPSRRIKRATDELASHAIVRNGTVTFIILTASLARGERHKDYPAKT